MSAPLHWHQHHANQQLTGVPQYARRLDVWKTRTERDYVLCYRPNVKWNCIPERLFMGTKLGEYDMI